MVDLDILHVGHIYDWRCPIITHDVGIVVVDDGLNPILHTRVVLCCARAGFRGHMRSWILLSLRLDFVGKRLRLDDSGLLFHLIHLLKTWMKPEEIYTAVFIDQIFTG